MSEYGDFEEIKDEKESNTEQENEQQIITRVKVPRKGEFIGIVLQRLGGNRMSIKTSDNKTRNCRVPGKFKRKFWIRDGNFVIVRPWPDDDDKGDIVYQYRPNEIIQLKKKGLTDNLNNEF